MTFIKCPKCGRQIVNNDQFCPGCGEKIEYSNTDSSTFHKTACKILIGISMITLIIGICLTKVGFDKKNKYYNSEFTSINENAYVGGDAYNYIINGTYFTGYVTLASGMYIIAAITMAAGLSVKVLAQTKE